MILSYRIIPPRYETDEQFDQLVAFLKAHRASVDEISFFTEYWHHVYFPLDKFTQRTAILRDRIVQLHDEGFKSVGINMLATIGHLNEAWDFLPAMPFPAIVGHDGKVSKSCACPISAEFRQYVREKYRLIADAQPDFIWVDDDMRVHHHGVDWGCFCQACVARFAQGGSSDGPARPADRQALVAALDKPENGQLREAWVEQNATVIEELLREIGTVVRKINPSIALGLMTHGPGWTAYSGQALDRWVTALGATRLRPGGGFYDDRSPRDMIGKALEMGRQNVAITRPMDYIAYELENFPYQKLDKSVQSVLNECLLALATGCNGIAFNALKDLPGSLDDYHDLLRAIGHERGLWERFLAAAKDLPLVGLWPAWSDRWSALRPLEPGQTWFDYGGGNAGAINTLAEIGLPLTLDPHAAGATLLWGKIAHAFSDDELRRMLGGGVILDPPALQTLHERGLGELAGVRATKSFDNGVWERLTTHPLNGRYAGEGRDARVSLWPTPAVRLEPIAGEVEDLAHLVGYDGSDQGMCLARCTNAAGGRIVTLGYAPWTRLANSAKRSQILALADWVTRGRLPLHIDEAVRVTPLVRMAHNRERFAAVLLNTAFDATGPLMVRIRTSARHVAILTSNGDQALHVENDGAELRVRLGGIEPWRAAVLVGT